MIRDTSLESGNELLQTLESFSNLPISLPLGHLSKADQFKHIVHSEQLKPQFCNVFQKELIYFSYGGIFHRHSALPKEDPKGLPIAFLFAPSLLKQIDDFYAFDTGAAVSGKFGSAISPHTHQNILEKYSFPGDRTHEVPRRLVQFFYGSNRAYLEGSLLEPTESLPSYYQRSFEVLAHDLSDLEVDHRQRIIECQAKENIPLADKLIWVGYHQSQELEVIELKKLLRKVPRDLQFKTFPYTWHKRYTPNEIAGFLMKEVEETMIEIYMNLEE